MSQTAAWVAASSGRSGKLVCNGGCLAARLLLRACQLAGGCCPLIGCQVVYYTLQYQGRLTRGSCSVGLHGGVTIPLGYDGGEYIKGPCLPCQQHPPPPSAGWAIKVFREISRNGRNQHVYLLYVQVSTMVPLHAWRYANRAKKRKLLRCAVRSDRCGSESASRGCAPEAGAPSTTRSSS